MMKLLAVLFLCVGLTACSQVARKEKKCAEAREKIIRLTLDVEEKLGKMAPKKERLSAAELRKLVQQRIDPDGTFVGTCVRSLSDEELECILEARKLSELGRCGKSEQ
jgi:hypothetical protein